MYIMKNLFIIMIIFALIMFALLAFGFALQSSYFFIVAFLLPFVFLYYISRNF